MKTIRNIKLLFIIMLTWVNSANGQSLSNTNLYTTNPYYMTPIAGKSQQHFFGFVNYQAQFTGVDNAPKTISFGLYSGLKNTNMGVGLRVFNDAKGIFESFYTNLTYQYEVPLSRRQHLTFGLSAGIVSKQLKPGELGDETINDPVIQNDAYNEINFNAGFGLSYSYDDLHIDVSFPELIEQKVGFNQDMFAMAEYDFQLQDPRWEISPSVAFFRHATSNNVVDGNIKLSWNQVVWIQPGYRSNGSIVASTGIALKNLHFVYSYQSYQGDLSAIANAGHEVGIVFKLTKRKQRPNPNAKMEKDIKDIKHATDKNALLLTALMEKYEKEEEKGKAKETENNEPARAIKVPNEVETHDQEHLSRLGAERDANLSLADLEKGYYIVISTFKSVDRAKRAKEMLGENKFNVDVVYQKKNGLYYVFSYKSETKEEAVDKMRQLRQSGLSSAWVLVVN